MTDNILQFEYVFKTQCLKIFGKNPTDILMAGTKSERDEEIMSVKRDFNK